MTLEELEEKVDQLDSKIDALETLIESYEADMKTAVMNMEEQFTINTSGSIRGPARIEEGALEAITEPGDSAFKLFARLWELLEVPSLPPQHTP